MSQPYHLTANSLPVTIPVNSVAGTADDFGAALTTALTNASLLTPAQANPNGCLICNDTASAIYLRSEADKAASATGISVDPGEDIWIPDLARDGGPDLWYEASVAFRATVTYP